MLKSDLLSHEILVEDFIMPNLVDEYKTIFWESKSSYETPQNLSPYIGISSKFVLKFVKILNWIFWAIEYWFKAL